MQPNKAQVVTRPKITIYANVWNYIKAVELGKYHQSLESYIEGICASFVLYKGNDAYLWLEAYLKAFKAEWFHFNIGLIRSTICYRENIVFPNSGEKFKKYQEFAGRLWQDKKAKKILLEFLESDEAEYIDAIKNVICVLNDLPNWYEICGEVYDETAKIVTDKLTRGAAVQNLNNIEPSVENLPIKNGYIITKSNQLISFHKVNLVDRLVHKKFSDYIPEQYQKSALLYLTERYTNAKPRLIWQMLLAATDLGVVMPKILNMTDSELLSIIEDQFGKIGKNGRRSFNSAKNTYNCPNKKQKADIELHRNKIKRAMKIDKL